VAAGYTEAVDYATRADLVWAHRARMRRLDHEQAQKAGAPWPSLCVVTRPRPRFVIGRNGPASRWFDR